jgi:hypothetical protein
MLKNFGPTNPLLQPSRLTVKTATRNPFFSLAGRLPVSGTGHPVAKTALSFSLCNELIRMRKTRPDIN